MTADGSAVTFDPGAVSANARFASAYRVEERGVVIIDQRLAPDRIEEIVCARAADVAFQMRTFACNGGALLAQVAAYGFALTANEAREWPQLRREAELRRSAQLLTYARPTAHSGPRRDRTDGSARPHRGGSRGNRR